MKFGKWLVTVQFVAVTAAFGIASHAAATNGPCAEDIKKFCSDVKPGAGGIAGCLKQHEAELSAACNTHQENLRNRADAFNAACGNDVQKFCGEVNPGKGRLNACLRNHHAELAEPCKQQFAKKPRKGPAAKPAAPASAPPAQESAPAAAPADKK